MGLVYSAFVPHPPIVVPEIGKGQEHVSEKTLQGYWEIAGRIVKAAPEAIVLVSPHAPLLEVGISVCDSEPLTGSFANFGVPEVKFTFPNAPDLLEEIQKELPRVILRRGEIDHGALVPLYFLAQAGWRGEVVLMGMPWHEPERYGRLLGQVLKRVPKKVALIASGDLSHKLRKDGPYGFDPAGPEFDNSILAGLTGNPAQLHNIPEEIVEAAGECGYRSLRLALAVQEGSAEVLSYEGPFGVGYLIAELYRPSPLAHWARTSLSEYLSGRDPLAIPLPQGSEFKERSGCFVTLKKNGELRGCIGTTQAYQVNLAAEIAHNAQAAGTEDPRFWPVEKAELPQITFSVDVLGEMERVKDKSELNPWRYGVVVRQRGRSGLLLPHLEGVDTVEDQLRIAKQKAGLNPDETVDMWRFEVVRHYE